MTHVKSARRLPIHQGPAAWNTLLGEQPNAEVQQGNEVADFVIIGGGFSGLSAARRLMQLQPNAKIVVLEAGRLAEGASGRNSGFMIDLPHDLASEDYAGKGLENDRAMISLNRQAIAFARDAVSQFEIKSDYFDEVGKVNGAASAKGYAHNLNYAQHLDTLGEKSEMLDQQQMRDLTGSGHYRSGLYTPGTVMLQPAGYIRGLGAGLRNHVSLYENSPATRFSRVGPDWRVSTPKGSIATGRILLTNNGHLESFGYEKGRQMQLFLYASMTPELDAETLEKLGGQSRWGVTPSDPMGTTMRRIDTGQGGNRIVTRTCATLKPNMTPTKSGVMRAANVQQKKFAQRFPQLANLKMEHCWAGHLCLSLNGVSIMREIDDGVFTGCMQNGLGTARGTLTGIGAAELACGETSDITTFFTGEERPKRLPPTPLAEIGANMVLRLKEWRAGNE
jgi:glycine/D-amino acid oxidase-like deaminating enzyme